MVLGQCASVDEAKKLLTKLNLVNINFSDKMQISPLHWLIADKTGKSITVESDADGLHVYDNKRITKVDLHKENLDSNKLITYPINDKIVFDEEN